MHQLNTVIFLRLAPLLPLPSSPLSPVLVTMTSISLSIISWQLTVNGDITSSVDMLSTAG